MKLRKRSCLWMGACVVLGGCQALAQVSLSTVVDLAVRNSAAVKAAVADVQRAEATLSESRDVYLPSFVMGSSIGYSYGFPVGQPSVYSITSQSLLYSFSQPDYIRAARAGLKSAELSLKDNEEQVALDTALAYIQLDNDMRELAALEEEKKFAEKLVEIERDRLVEGVDGRMEVTKAELASAQVDERRLHLESGASQLQQKLQHLTGLPAASFVTDTKSIPASPVFSQTDTIEDTLATTNAGIQAAYANAKSKRLTSFGDEKQNFRPQFAFGAEYNRYAKFNNYEEYYLRFQHNNFDIGVQITFPIFDASRRAKARQSAAEAARAGAEADQTKFHTSEEAYSLRHSILELENQERIAKLRNELAQEQLESIQAQLQGGSGSPNAAPVTPRDEQQARIQERERYQDALDAQFSVIRVELSLMRSLGQITEWVHSGK
ncbi:MAG TPA: TolC family protein [Silvibacterium sp.]|nr:TolC family protein [Silvibacterium sp.]